MHPIIRCRHSIPGRMRLHLPLSKNNFQLHRMIQAKIYDITGVFKCSVNPSLGSILVYYDVQMLEPSSLLKHIEHILALPGQGSNRNVCPVLKTTLNEAAAQLQIPGRVKGLQDLWYEMAAEDVIQILSSNSQTGLSMVDCQTRLHAFGANHFAESPRPSKLSLFLGQFNMMTRLLLGASGISLVMGQLVDAVSILVIVLMEAMVGMVQENRAEESLAGLKQLASPEAIVIREGRQNRVVSSELVPGDIVLLEPGSLVPADCRLVAGSNLEVREEMLTGESNAVRKQFLPRQNQALNLAEQDNMVFMGTYVTRGRARAVVVKTGSHTEMGKIAASLEEMESDKTPLQKQLDKLSRDLSYVCLGVSAGITLFGILGGQAVFNMLRTGVSLAVGAIPEGLPAIITISMAFGVQRMAQKNAVVRRLPVVETLAYATVICSDKTGTLTSNEMTVTELYCENRCIDVTGTGYNPAGYLVEGARPLEAEHEDTLFKLLLIGALCNNACLWYEEPDRQWHVLGDPTEAALLVLARKAGIDQARLETIAQREIEVPFESDTRVMAVVLRTEDGERVVFVKGSPEQVLEHCSSEYSNQEERELTLKRRNQILAMGEDMAARALRVIACAYKVLPVDDTLPAALFSDLVFTGLAGMMDPPRPEVKRAAEKCKQAGVKITMITGDQQQTAAAIARELDILDQGWQVSGNEIDAMSDEVLAASIANIGLIYRASPAQKLRIVRAYKQQGFVVVMTGDGVNDAPAVKEAHVGISMGRMGTDVTREASGITLMDDSFATIITAIEEGRAIRGNIRKFIRYVLAGNLGEIIAISGCSLLGLPIALEPGHILWVNLVTEGIPALALGMDPPDPGCMQKPPEDPNQMILDNNLRRHIITRGSTIGTTTLGVFAYGLLTGPGNLSRARTMALTNLVSCQMFNVFDSRYINEDISRDSIPRNSYLLPSVMLSSGLMLGIMYIPWLRGIFSTYPLGFRDLITVLLSSGLISRVDSLRKAGPSKDYLPLGPGDAVIPIHKNKPLPAHWNCDPDNPAGHWASGIDERKGG